MILAGFQSGMIQIQEATQNVEMLRGTPAFG
jgi:hypothetical protein